MSLAYIWKIKRSQNALKSGNKTGHYEDSKINFSEATEEVDTQKSEVEAKSSLTPDFNAS